MTFTSGNSNSGNSNSGNSNSGNSNSGNSNSGNSNSGNSNSGNSNSGNSNSGNFNSSDRDSVLEILREAKKELTSDQIVEKLRVIKCSIHPDDFEDIHKILAPLVFEGQIKGRLSRLSETKVTFSFNSHRRSFPGSEAWFKIYLSYTSKSGYNFIYSLLQFVFKSPKKGENQWPEPDLEKITSILHDHMYPFYEQIYFIDQMSKKFEPWAIYRQFLDIRFIMSHRLIFINRLNEELNQVINDLEIPNFKEDLVKEFQTMELNELNELSEVNNTEKAKEDDPAVAESQFQFMEEETSFTSNITYEVKLGLKIPKGSPLPVLVPGKQILVTESKTHPGTRAEIHIPYCLPGDQPRFISHLIPAPPRTGKQGSTKISINLDLAIYTDDLSATKKITKTIKSKMVGLNCLSPTSP